MGCKSQKKKKNISSITLYSAITNIRAISFYSAKTNFTILFHLTLPLSSLVVIAINKMLAREHGHWTTLLQKIVCTRPFLHRSTVHTLSQKYSESPRKKVSLSRREQIPQYMYKYIFILIFLYIIFYRFLAQKPDMFRCIHSSRGRFVFMQRFRLFLGQCKIR